MVIKLNMAAILAKARAAKKPPPQQEQEPVPDFSSGTIIPMPASEVVANSNVPAPASNIVAMSAIAGLRARLKEAAARDTAKLQSQGIQEEVVATVEVVTVPSPNGEAASSGALGMHGEAITYNSQQQEFIQRISSGESCVLIGAAGTGKTTCSQGGTKALIASGKITPLCTEGHRHLISGSPGILIISYTRRAVNNIRKVQADDLKNNCITSHKLLEYAPEYYEIEDPETGATRKTMRFEPTRRADNPLPDSICTIIVEEASMLSVGLFSEITAALEHTVQWVFIGDIQQLPPVFGPAILGFKMLELPVIELTEVYRQALKSPIIRLAHRVLSGKPIPLSEYEEWKIDNEHGKLTIHPWKKKISADDAASTLAAFFKKGVDNGVYNPDEDMILIPYNKACGTIEINAHIANHLARKREVMTYEVMAGFNKLYFSVGDKVLYDKEDAEIIAISPNPSYNGGRIQPPSKTLDYWGHNPNLMKEATYNSSNSEMDADFLLDAVATSDERVTQASHEIVVRLYDTATELSITKAADVNAMLHAYALTVHKAQGSEWNKVFLCFHQSHATMLQRELLYTGITRASKELYIICEPESFTRGIVSQRIKGNTIAEKAVFFKGKLEKSND